MTEKIAVITGPTATGKTGIAVALAKMLDAEVVSADSMQVYRGFDIGTAKPTPAERDGIPHHLIDVVDPAAPFDAARFKRLADAVIDEIHARGRRVLVVGGTGLYIRALLHGLQKGPSPDPEIRKVLLERGRTEGWPALHRELLERDEPTGRRLHPNDGVRILRALEVVLSSRIPLSTWHAEHQFRETRYDALLLVLKRPRAELNAIIEKRVDEMMAQGFLEETRALLEKGLSPALKPMQGLGYKRLVAHLLGELTLEEAVEKTKTDTRRFAKRQVTWFKKEPDIEWVSPDIATVSKRVSEHFSVG